MKVLVCGSTGCIGSAVVGALRSRGHQVVAAARRPEGAGWAVDFMAPVTAAAWAARLRGAGVEAVVNCAGILMERDGQRFERVHAQGPAELFEGAALAGVSRVVQVSALGASAGGGSPYLRSKQQADAVLLALQAPTLAATVLRPSLVHGPGCASTPLFATLAALPVIALPGGGRQLLRPIHVYELAEIVVRCLERRDAATGVFDVGGGDTLSYRDMLAAYRAAQNKGEALWLPLPMAAMQFTAWAAEALPQSVLCRETVALLRQGSVPAQDRAADLLGRAPTPLAAGLRITPPRPWLDLGVQLSAPVALLLRSTLAFMWLWTALVSAALPEHSGVLALLARCGFSGDAGVAVLMLSCSLNAAIGITLLRGPAPWAHALQVAAIVGYTTVAAINMPELTLDHCAPLAKNLALGVAALLLWLAEPPAPPPLARRAAALRPNA